MQNDFVGGFSGSPMPTFSPPPPRMYTLALQGGSGQREIVASTCTVWDTGVSLLNAQGALIAWFPLASVRWITSEEVKE